MLVDEREIDGHAAELFEQALALAPDNPRALWYGGITAYRRGNMALARERWVELQNHDLPPELRQVLAERLAELGQADDAPAVQAPSTAAAGAVEISIALDAALAGRVPANATLFVIAAVLVSGITLRQAAQRLTAPVSMRTVFAGFAYIRSRPVLLGAISLDLFAVLLGGAVALLPIYARDILHTGPWGLGLLRSSPAVGALVMALWLARHPLNRRAGRIMFGAVALFGAATVVFGVSTWLPLSMVALVVLGASDMISVVVRSTLVQLDTPDDMRGRVGAVNSVFIGASNQLGEFESGVTAALFGPVGAVILGGVGTLLVVAVWMRLFPALASRDRLHEHAT